MEENLRDLWALDDEQKDAIKDLKKHPGFTFYIERLYYAELFALREAMSKEGTVFHKGIFNGLSQARKMIETIIAESQKDLIEPDLDPDEGHRRGM